MTRTAVQFTLEQDMRCMGRKSHRLGTGLIWTIVLILALTTVPSHAASNRGDLNLDGISYSVADWMVAAVFIYGCIMDPGPWPPLDVQEQADLDCDGRILLTEFIKILYVLTGTEPQYDCPLGTTTNIPSRVRRESITASDGFTVEIRNQLIAGVDTGWVEIVLTEAPDVMTSFQFNIEYDTDRLEFVDFVDGVFGDHLDPRGRKNEVISEPGKSCLRIVGQHCGPAGLCSNPLTVPDLPATLMKLKFRVRTPDEDFATELNFAWDYCFDNGISVGPEYEGCGWWPDYLAVSSDVYNASGDNITGSDIRYGGAGEDCMVGGPRDVPVRQIDFHSGTLSYQQSCCIDQVGDANGIGGDEPTIGDVSVMIDAKFITGRCDGIIACLAEADINHSGGDNPTCDDISIGDIGFLIDYMFITSFMLKSCF
jgi:hypothetical protein